MKRLLLSFFLLTGLFISGCGPKTPGERVLIISSGGNYRVFHVELALTQEEQVRGLMDRDSLPEDSGMLFLWDTSEPRSFWMKDTKIPLDMLFIDESGKIVTLHENAVPEDTTSISSDVPVKAVLELAGGTVSKLGIKTGDIVHHPAFGNELARKP